MALLRCALGVWALAAALALQCEPMLAQQPEAGEAAIKAAFLYNFTKFVEWPATAFEGSDGAFRVCIAADARFVAEIDVMLRGEQVQGRPVRLLVSEPADPAKSCHMLYFGANETGRAGRSLSVLKHAPVLTVGEGERFLEYGGMIAFLVHENRVKFDINKGVLDRAGITVSSKLLRVARRVHTEPLQ